MQAARNAILRWQPRFSARIQPKSKSNHVFGRILPKPFIFLKFDKFGGIYFFIKTDRLVSNRVRNLCHLASDRAEVVRKFLRAGPTGASNSPGPGRAG